MKISRNEIYAYRLVTPYILFVVVFLTYLLSINLINSLSHNNAFTYKHYVKMVEDPLLPKLMLNTLIWVIGSVAGQFILGFGVALLLQKVTIGQLFFRSVIFMLPWATLDIVAGVTWKWMYNDLYGVFNDLLIRAGLIAEPISWLGNKNVALFSVIISNIWKGFSLAGIFLLARLQTISKELFESADIDGANIFQKFFYITLPQVKTVALSTLLLMVIWTINYFPLIFILTQGGPNFATETFVTYIYRIRFRFLETGLASAYSNVLFILILAVSFVFLKNIKKEDE